MASEWVAGAFGLLGAVMGTTATAWVSLRQQRHDTQTEQERRANEVEDALRKTAEERKREIEAAREAARVAARILQADSLQSRLRIEKALENGKYWSEPFALPHQSWGMYREQVARYLDLEAWSQVSKWFRSVVSLESQAASARAVHPDVRRPGVSARGEKQLKLAIKRSDQALLALQAFTQDDTQRLSDDEDDDGADD